jgi:predicted DNA-binding transcriptional regulator YafY
MMDRASANVKAERLNHARELLQRFDHLPDAVAQMAQDRGVSPRQAYRYLQQARRLRQPVPIGDAKVAFTVKLSQALVRRVRSFANATGLSLSEIVSRALLAVLKQRRGRG